MPRWHSERPRPGDASPAGSGAGLRAWSWGRWKLNLVRGHFGSGGNRTPKHSPTITQPTPRCLLSNPESESLLPWSGASLLGLD